MATLNLGRVRGDKGEDSTVPGPRGIPGPPGPQGPKGEDATNANLGTAATKDVGTGAEQIPQNKDLGSAAYKNSGEATGNVMPVGAFGLGSNGGSIYGETVPQVLINSLKAKGSSFFRNDVDNPLGLRYSSGIFSYVGNTYFGLTVSHSTTGVRVFGSYDNYPPIIRDLATVDPSNNLAISSIQAGFGAPKIAYKKITGTTSSAISSSVTLQTGIAADKIIGMSCLVASEKGLIPPNTYPNGGAELYYCVVNPDGSIKVSLSSGSASYGVVSKPITILLTYEV